MKEMQFVVKISAPKETVWQTLWQDDTFRQWAGVIDPGTFMVGDLNKGSEVQFVSSENGYGVTSLVEKLVVNEYLLLQHSADTQENGEKEREKEWTGGKEIYELSEQGNITILTVSFDVPEKMEDYFKVNYPEALALVKSLAEKPQS